MLGRTNRKKSRRPSLNHSGDAETMGVSVRTMRRRTDNEKIYLTLRSEAGTWACAILGLDEYDCSEYSEAERFFEACKTGTIFCELVERITGRKVKNFHSEKLVERSRFFARENVVSFLDACRNMGVEQAVIFSPDDLVEGKNMEKVVKCLLGLAAIAANRYNVKPPRVVELLLEAEADEAEADKAEADEWEDVLADEIILEEEEDTESGLSSSGFEDESDTGEESLDFPPGIVQPDIKTGDPKKFPFVLRKTYGHNIISSPRRRIREARQLRGRSSSMYKSGKKKSFRVTKKAQKNIPQHRDSVFGPAVSPKKKKEKKVIRKREKIVLQKRASQFGKLKLKPHLLENVKKAYPDASVRLDLPKPLSPSVSEATKKSAERRTINYSYIQEQKQKEYRKRVRNRKTSSPTTIDPLDVHFKKRLKEIGVQGIRVQKLKRGVYLLGNEKLVVKQINGILVARVGGGFREIGSVLADRIARTYNAIQESQEDPLYQVGVTKGDRARHEKRHGEVFNAFNFLEPEVLKQKHWK
eukprot:g3612.t1